MVTFEALQAKYGDCLLLRYTDKGGTERLWVVDGGPSGIYPQVLKPRLEELRGDAAQLRIDLAMVSHIDDDHINGMAQLLRDLLQQKSKKKTPWLDIKRFWFNSFCAITGGAAVVSGGMVLAGTGGAPLAQSDLRTDIGRAILASVGQGDQITADLVALGIPLNGPKNTLVSSPGSQTVDGAKVTILGPMRARLQALQKKWKKESKVVLAGYMDDSVPNLSSLAMLVEIDGRKILLTGDALGDDIVQVWNEGSAAPQKQAPVDILKMPHHGSFRNVSQTFLEKFPAKHYVFSANGNYDNPDDETLELLVETQKNRDYTIHVTGPMLEYACSPPKPTQRVQRLLAELNKGKNFTYVIDQPVLITL